MGAKNMDYGLAARAAALNLGGLFRFNARYASDRIALEDAQQAYTYAQLNERANRVAHVLAASGVVHGDRVAILSENRTEYVELLLAAAKLGVIVAALNWRLTAEELEHCVGLARPKVMLASSRYRKVADSLSNRPERVVSFGDGYEAMLASASPHEPPDVAEPEDGLIILYTSGTTGLPKGALISHRAMIARGQLIQIDRMMDPSDSFVAWAPLFHMVSTDSVLATLASGGKVLVVDGFDTERLVDIVARERIGWFVLMPGMIDAFMSALRERHVTPWGIKAIGCMADLVPRHQIAEVTTLMQAPYINSFGSSETGAAPASRTMLDVGKVPKSLSKMQSSFCEIRLVDDNDNEVADGEPGELTMRGPTLFSGYWHAPETNAEDFRGGWFHMGDVFVRNADGTLDFVDRRKYLIKSGGENIYPAEIERVLLADERIAEAVVVRRPDPVWGEVPVVFVVRQDDTLTDADVMSCCDGRIARYKQPKSVRFVQDSDLPRSTTGKIKRHELESAFEDEQGSS